ncbi:MAG: amidase [Herbaspirillum sp.]|jgi:acetamidase/formamidase|nr:amidase [Herbaspirillum sp.]
MNAHHKLPASPQTIHWGYFDSSIAPAMRIASGDRVTIDTLSGSKEESAQTPTLLPEHAAVLENCAPQLGPHILTGPIWVEGAEPGDTLEIRVESIALRQNWGYNVVRPLRGGLIDDFRTLQILNIPIDIERREAHLPWGLTVPLKPFFGIMAVAPRPEYGRVSSIEPREYGGNMDNKELVEGSTLLLPVQVPGALFSVGDGHAVQGDGEVSLTALETALTGTFQIVLHKATGLNFPRAITPTHYIAMGLDPDLDDAAKQAVREMVAWLVELKGWSPIDAYVSCSLACDLHVTQIVDGNKGVHAMFPRALLDKP